MKIAVEGCAHGELENIYDVITHLEEENKIKVDLLLICGDFQSVRNETDLECMAVPVCYRHMQSFYKYYSGEKIAPILTIFVGGNHEASNYLSELNYGGWVCPNIYYLGKAGVINVGGLRIAGMSGIYNGNSYLKGVYEIPPYDKSSLRTVYHVRNLDIYKLSLIKNPIDIMLSHDWPRGIYNHGDCNQLLRKKPFFRDEIDNGSLGSPPAEKLLNTLKPKYWFAAHLHCKFAAIVNHENGQSTKFLALDKCLPHRKFLQIIDIETTKSGPYKISYDLEWLAILKETDSLINMTRNYTILPDPNTFDNFFKEIDSKCEEIYKILKNSDLTSKSDQNDLEEDGNFEIQNALLNISTDFEISVPPFTGTKTQKYNIPQPILTPNVQTTKFCKVLGLTDPAQKLIEMYQDDSYSRLTVSSVSGIDDPQTDLEYLEGSSKNPDEIDLLESDGVDDEIETPKDKFESTKETEDSDNDNDLSHDDSFKLFVIDRKPTTSTVFKRMSMILPDPVNKPDDVSTDTTTLEESDTSIKRMCADNHTPVPVSIVTSEETTVQSTLITKGTFKRRNQAIYATKNSDDES